MMTSELEFLKGLAELAINYKHDGTSPEKLDTMVEILNDRIEDLELNQLVVEGKGVFKIEITITDLEGTEVEVNAILPHNIQVEKLIKSFNQTSNVLNSQLESHLHCIEFGSIEEQFAYSEKVLMNEITKS